MGPPASSKGTHRLGLSGAFAGGLVGLIWAALYWQLPRYAAAIVFAHIALGVVLAAAVRFLPAGRRLRLSATGFLGVILGIFWTAPILLFLLDSRYFDLRTDSVGALVAAAVVAASGALGAVLGNSFASRRLPAAAFLLAWATAAPAISFWAFFRPPTPTFHVLNRLGGGRIDARGKKARAMVIGVDGASWNVVLPMLRSGELPNLKSLMERGRYGILESVKSSSGDIASPVIWTSIFTGTIPSSHGITDWMVADSRNRRRKSLWNILNDQGRPAIVVNVPGTFPPEVVNGAMISGFPIPGVVRASSNQLWVSEGRVYTTKPLELRVVASTAVTIRPAPPGRWNVGSYSPPLEIEMPLLENLDTHYGGLRHLAYDLRLGNLFLELLERRGMAQTQEVASYHLVLTDQRDDGAANYDGVRVYDDSRPSEPPAALLEGEWSEWMSVTARGERLAFKLKLLEVSESRVAIYATPLFQSSAAPIIPFTYPAGLSNRLSREIGQYVVEGAGWLMCEDEVLLDALYEHVADVAENHLDASTFLLAAMPEPGLFVHLLTETDRIQHAYWRFHEASELEDPELVARHGDKVRRMMSETDERIGKLLEYADEDTVIAVVSDHGFRSGPASGPGAHSVEGIYVFAGKGIEPASVAPTELDAANFHRANVVDVTPTLLYLLGYPAAKDMDGRALVELADQGQRRCCPLRFVDSYESGARAHDGERREIDDATREQLKSLGYVQ